MRRNRIKQAWREGRPVTIAWLGIPSPFSAEVMARHGFDGLCVDMQHGLIDYSDAWLMLQAISQTEAVPIVRVPWNDPAILMKVLDAGAYGVVVPLVNSGAEAAAAVGACRFPPQGIRSYGPIRAGLYGGTGYVEGANEEIIVLAMIETRQGLDNLEEICATPGLDGVYIGPADLSYALGLPPRADNADPRHLEACNRIREAAHRHGKKAGMHTASAAFAADALARGFDLVTLTSDVACLSSAARAQLDQLAALVRGTDAEAGGGERASSPY